MRFKRNQSMGEISHQHIQAPMAAAMSLLALSPSTWMNEMWADHNTGRSMLYSLWIVSGFLFTSHWVVWTVKGYEKGHMVYSPYPKRLESLIICRCNNKGSTSSIILMSVELTPYRMAARCSTSWTVVGVSAQSPFESGTEKLQPSNFVQELLI